MHSHPGHRAHVRAALLGSSARGCEGSARPLRADRPASDVAASGQASHPSLSAGPEGGAMSAGRLKVDRWFDGVRINRASGATTAREHGKRNDFLTWLHDTGRLEILHAIAANRLSIAHAYAAHCAGKLTFAVND